VVRAGSYVPVVSISHMIYVKFGGGRKGRYSYLQIRLACMRMSAPQLIMPQLIMLTLTATSSWVSSQANSTPCVAGMRSGMQVIQPEY
jgi:hypothetical protein